MKYYGNCIDDMRVFMWFDFFYNFYLLITYSKNTLF